MSVKVDRSHAFVATIALGTPPQQLKCLVDTGSADLWVPSKRCGNCGGQHHFFADTSSTFAPKYYETVKGPRPKIYQVTYGSGMVTGFGVQDTFSFGSWKVKNQSFIIVEDQDLPPSMPWDGIFGLGWNGISKVGKPVYQRLQEAGHPAIFALVPTRKGEATLVLGVVPEAEIKPGTLVWVKSEDLQLPRQQGENERNFWVVSGGIAITRDHATSAKFVVDTGTNQMLLVPSRLFPSFIRSLLPAESFERHCGMDISMGNLIICDCAVGESGKLPPLRLYLGERQFEVPIAELFTKVKARDTGGPLCLLQVQPNDMGPPALDGMLGGLLPGILNAAPISPGVAGGGPLPPLLPLAPSSGSSSHDAQPSESAENGVPSFPFQIPAFPAGLQLPKNLKPGDTVEEIVRTEPDGALCTTSVITEPSGAQRKTFDCRKPDEQKRRLQGGLLAPILEAIPAEQSGGEQMQGEPVAIMQPVPMQQPAGAMPILAQPIQGPIISDPMADLWVLGGVFMEKFVVIFDFDQKRVGFAEPVKSSSSFEQKNYQQQSENQAYLPRNTMLSVAASAARPEPVDRSAVPLQADKHQVEQGGWPSREVGVIGVIGVGVAGLLAMRSMPWSTPRNVRLTSASSAPDEDCDFPGE